MALDKIDIVLVEPIYAGNVGAAARSASNYGVHSIKIVGNLDYHSLEAKKMALYGYPLLEKAVRFENLNDALKTNSLVIGTVHQSRFNRTPLQHPWDLFANLSGRLLTEPTAIVFGRETNGLTREEINLCHFLTIIPTDEKMSFNVAHSVTVFLYEAFRSTFETENKPFVEKPSQEDWEECFGIFEKAMASIGFFKNRQQLRVMSSLRDIAYRSNVHSDDLPLLNAVLYKIAETGETEKGWNNIRNRRDKKKPDN